MAHSFDQGPKPRKPAAPAALANVLPHGTTPNFYYKHHPLRWRHVDGEWLPILGTMRLDMGANGVDKTGNIDEAVMMSDKRKWTLIPWNRTQDGESYVNVWDCQGGLFHCSIWETPQWIGDRVLESKSDTEGYNNWLRWLMAEGYIPEPKPAILAQVQIEQQEKKVENLRKDSAKPGVEELFIEAKEELADQKHATTELAKPKAKRTKRKRAPKKPVVQ